MVDAKTNEPITKFRITNGVKWDRDDASFSWSRYRRDDIDNANGAFRRRWTGYGISYPLKSVAGLKIEAPGYLPGIVGPQELDHPCEPATVRLRRGVSIAGTVVGPDGQRISQAQVAFVGPGRMAFIEGCQFSSTGYITQAENIMKTGDNGRFELPPVEGNGLIVAVHEAGYAKIQSTDFTPGGRIQLTPWARLEGTIDRKQLENEDVEIVFQVLEQGNTEEPSIHWVGDRHAVTGDTFSYNFLPAIPLAVGPIRRYEMHDAALLQPEPGETCSITIGTPGRTVTGRIPLFPGTELTDPRRTHAVAFRIDEDDATPSRIGSIVETSFEWLWKDATSVYKPSQTVWKRFIPYIAADGQFTFDSLAPGEYEFVVNLHAPLGKNVSCGRGVLEGVAITRFIIHEGESNAPRRLGDCFIRSITYPGTAPLFEVQTFDGKTLRLADLRGKVVLLDFWATWCEPCVAQLPAMQTLYEAFADRDDFVMIGMSLDSDEEKARRLAETEQLGWPQTCIGPMDESMVARQYGVGGIPMTILIDAEGTIVARDVESKLLKQMIQRTLDKNR